MALSNTELLGRINACVAANLPFHFIGSDLTDLQTYLAAHPRSNGDISDPINNITFPFQDGVEIERFDADSANNTDAQINQNIIQEELARRALMSDIAHAIGSFRVSAEHLREIKALVN